VCVVLVGLPGSGKTTLAKQIADRLSLCIFDTDALLVEKTGVSVSAIFEFEGETGFRNRETRLLTDLLAAQTIKTHDCDGCAVVATGGGVVIRPENRVLLKKLGRVVYLHTQPELIISRLVQDKNRPLVRAASRTNNLSDFIKTMYAIRDPLYREVADDVIECLGGPLSEALKKIIPLCKQTKHNC
jgi:shikimate kinase